MRLHAKRFNQSLHRLRGSGNSWNRFKLKSLVVSLIFFLLILHWFLSDHEERSKYISKNSKNWGKWGRREKKFAYYVFIGSEKHVCMGKILVARLCRLTYRPDIVVNLEPNLNEEEVEFFDLCPHRVKVMAPAILKTAKFQQSETSLKLSLLNPDLGYDAVVSLDIGGMLLKSVDFLFQLPEEVTFASLWSNWGDKQKLGTWMYFTRPNPDFWGKVEKALMRWPGLDETELLNRVLSHNIPSLTQEIPIYPFVTILPESIAILDNEFVLPSHHHDVAGLCKNSFYIYFNMFGKPTNLDTHRRKWERETRLHHCIQTLYLTYYDDAIRVCEVL